MSSGLFDALRVTGKTEKIRDNARADAGHISQWWKGSHEVPFPAQHLPLKAVHTQA